MSSEEKKQDAAAAATSIEEQMQVVVDLMEAGTATNEQVEAAVDRLLNLQGHHHASTNTKKPSMKTTVKLKPDAEPKIEQDMEDYDDLDDDEPDYDETAKKIPAKETRATRQKQVTPARKRSSPVAAMKEADDDHNVDDDDEVDWSMYEDIPLGRSGAQMMISFGDGKRPNPAAVKATLEGARHMLQTAVQDARHIRRKQKKIYRSAKNSIQTEPKKPDQLKAEWSAEMLYRAAAGYDRLAYDPKCGFGIEDLRQLFPEVMNEYRRWNEMHAATEKSNAAANEEGDIVVVEETATAANNNADTAITPATEQGLAKQKNDDSNAAVVVGHLQERAAQFDLRTKKMQGEWYMKYAQLRRGSFLPRQRGRMAQADADWEASRKPRGAGEHAIGCWSHMSAATVRFLHWVGFEPTSRLPPPSDETTDALAFLAYDCFGRIVEKAILLRNVEKRRVTGGEVNEAAILVELDPGEQLEENDIVRAMEDPDIKPVPLFSSSTEKKIGSQLYFGPGFEDRLELEMEEMLYSSKKLSEEELKIRQEEDELFAELSKPPTRDGIETLLAAKESSGTDKSEEKSGGAQKSAKRPRKA